MVYVHMYCSKNWCEYVYEDMYECMLKQVHVYVPKYVHKTNMGTCIQ